MSREERGIYNRYGKLLLDAGTLAATDLPMLESAARVLADLQELRRKEDASPATKAALERLHKEQLIQLGFTPAGRKAVQRLEAALDEQGERLRNLLG